MLRQLRNIFSNEVTTPVTPLIDTVLEQMHASGPDTEEYQRLMKHLKQLYKLKAQDRPKPVSWDNVILVAGNLLGIVVIVAYEQRHVMMSKGLSQIIRLSRT